MSDSEEQQEKVAVTNDALEEQKNAVTDCINGVVNNDVNKSTEDNEINEMENTRITDNQEVVIEKNKDQSNEMAEMEHLTIDEGLQKAEQCGKEIPKVMEDLVLYVIDEPPQHVELEKLDARYTPSIEASEENVDHNDREDKEIENEDQTWAESYPDHSIVTIYDHKLLIILNYIGSRNLALEKENEGEVQDSECVEYDRERLLQQYKESLEERARIQQLNQQYQHKLAEYFKKKKTDEKGQDLEKNVTDQEQRYLKYMSNLEELQTAEARQANSIEAQLKELKEKCQEKQNKVEESSSAFMTFKYDIGKNAINSRSGKPIPAKDLEAYKVAEQKKENEVIAVRLENIKLKNRLKKWELQLKAKEELAEGLHLIDFEQLKIENQTYNEKIEERNEELLKLRKKIHSTVQVLTHLKEKLQHVQGENGEQRSNLRDIDATVAKKRDVLTRMKQARDSLRFDNTKLKHKAGLLGNKPLLQDFEVRKEESEELRQKLATLKERHLELNITLNGVRKKIDSAKGEMQ